MNSYVLSFGPSRSPRYGRAVKLADLLPGHRMQGDRHLVLLSEAYPEVMDELLTLVADWRTTDLLVNGHPIGRGPLWDVLRMLRCCARYDVADIGSYYCHGYPGEPGRVPCRLIDADIPHSEDPAYAEDDTFPILLGAHERRTFADACPYYERDAVIGFWFLWKAMQPQPEAFERLLGDINIDL